MFVVRIIRVIIRLILFLLISLICALAALFMRAFGVPHSVVFRVYNAWKGMMFRVLGVRVEWSGDVPQEPAILMANHRSYVDVLMFSSAIPVVFVAKASVRRWPIIGWGADGLRTVWVDRKSQESRRKTREQLRLRLADGKSVVIFPEGTTHRGPEILELKPGMFHTCAEGGFPIVPVAIEYEDPTISWTGKELFLPHFLQQFSKPHIHVRVKYGDPVSGSDGEQLRQQVAHWMTEQINTFRMEWDATS